MSTGPVPAVRAWRLGPFAFRLVPASARGADLEPVFGLIVLGLLAALRLLPLELIATVLGPCQFHLFTGYPCLTCGTTRTVLALGRGDLALALRMNPLVAIVTVVAAVWSPVALVLWIARLPRPRLGLSGRRARWTLGLTVALLLAAQWAFLIVDGR